MDNFDGGSVVYGHLAGSGRFGQDSVDKLEEVLMGMISIDRQYRTENGFEVRIYAVDGSKERQVHGAYFKDGEWHLTSWCLYGRRDYWCDGQFDLVEVKPRIQREYWVNVYPMYCSFWEEKEHADSDTSNRRLACVKITIDCEEGEGL